MASTSHGTGMKAPYHLVEPSAWPIIGSFAVFVLTFGTISYLHPSLFGTGLEPMFKALGPWKILIGVGLVLFTMAGWWRDVVKEARTPGLHSSVVQLGLRYGMFLFIASEVMFFVAWFWAFFHYGLFPEHHPSGQWPPQGITTFNPWGLPFLNTVILLTSGTTITWAHHALLERNKQGLVWGLALTILLGVVFTFVQAYEYGHAPYKFGEGVFGGVFFMATGFHGAHVIIGTIFLIVCFFRATKDHFTPERHFGFEAAAWYWHFVDVVWLFLFFAIYIWGASSVTVG